METSAAIDTSFLRPEAVLARRGCQKTQLYREIKRGVVTPGIKKGLKWVVWPAYEIDAINRAEIAGATQDELRALVRQLLEQRKQMSPARATSPAAA
jgi:prophage regulatory protein